MDRPIQKTNRFRYAYDRFSEPVRNGIRYPYFSLKYVYGDIRLYIGELHERLIDLARNRIRSGLATERGLARLSGISQPHMHNVMKRTRELSIPASNRLMMALGISVTELIWLRPEEIETEVRAVPVMRSHIGPGAAAAALGTRGYWPFPESRLKGLVDPMAARLAPDPAMPDQFLTGDIVLLDQNPALRKSPWAGSCWVVAEHTGLRVRYVRLVRGGIAVEQQDYAGGQRMWEPVPMKGRNILEMVRARIVWFSRNLEAQDDRPADAAGKSA